MGWRWFRTEEGNEKCKGTDRSYTDNKEIWGASHRKT